MCLFFKSVEPYYIKDSILRSETDEYLDSLNEYFSSQNTLYQIMKKDWASKPAPFTEQRIQAESKFSKAIRTITDKTPRFFQILKPYMTEDSKLRRDANDYLDSVMEFLSSQQTLYQVISRV